MKNNKLYKLIEIIRKTYCISRNYRIPSDPDLHNLVNLLNKACFLYPTQTKCLAWSTALVILGLKRGWRLNLSIGVQNYPFMAHAWVECEGRVISDTQKLPDQMAVILKEPFRIREI